LAVFLLSLPPCLLAREVFNAKCEVEVNPHDWASKSRMLAELERLLKVSLASLYIGVASSH